MKRLSSVNSGKWRDGTSGVAQLRVTCERSVNTRRITRYNELCAITSSLTDCNRLSIVHHVVSCLWSLVGDFSTHYRHWNWLVMYCNYVAAIYTWQNTIWCKLQEIDPVFRSGLLFFIVFLTPIVDSITSLN